MITHNASSRVACSWIEYVDISLSVCIADNALSFRHDIHRNSTLSDNTCEPIALRSIMSAALSLNFSYIQVTDRWR